MVGPPPVASGKPSPDPEKAALFYEMMMRHLEVQYQLYAQLASRATQWASIGALVVTFLSTILAVERADLADWMAAILVGGFALFLTGMIVLYFAQNAVLDAAPGPEWDDLVENVYDTDLSPDDMRYAIAEHFAAHQLREGENELERRGVALNRGISVVAAGVVLIFVVTLALIVRHPSTSASIPHAPETAPTATAAVRSP